MGGGGASPSRDDGERDLFQLSEMSGNVKKKKTNLFLLCCEMSEGGVITAVDIVGNVESRFANACTKPTHRRDQCLDMFVRSNLANANSLHPAIDPIISSASNTTEQVIRGVAEVLATKWTYRENQ